MNRGDRCELSHVEWYR